MLMFKQHNVYTHTLHKHVFKLPSYKQIKTNRYVIKREKMYNEFISNFQLNLQLNP